MIHSNLNTIVLFVFQLAVVFNCSSQNKLQFAEFKTDSLMNSIENREDIVGVSITIGIKDSIIYSKGFGFINLEKKIKTQSYHKFRVYSLSKHITAIALAKLYENGQIDLDMPIDKYLPFIDSKLSKITTRQLIGHLSGVRSYRDEEWQIFSNNKCSNPMESMMFFQSDSLQSNPGEKYGYTTYGYVILSAIIEKISEETFIDYLNDKIFRPIGIQNIKLDDPEVVDYLAAKPYEYYKKVMYPARYANNTCKFGGGALLASTEDMVRFNLALLNNKVITPETLKMVLSEMKLNNGELSDYGFGYQLETDKKGNFLAWHSGRSRGGRNALIIYPKYKLVICISANTNGDRIVNEAEEIANYYIDSLKP